MEKIPLAAQVCGPLGRARSAAAGKGRSNSAEFERPFPHVPLGIGRPQGFTVRAGKAQKATAPEDLCGLPSQSPSPLSGKGLRPFPDKVLRVQNHAGVADPVLHLVVDLPVVLDGGGDDAVDPDSPRRRKSVLQLQIRAAGVADGDHRLIPHIPDAGADGAGQSFSGPRRRSGRFPGDLPESPQNPRRPHPTGPGCPPGR